MLPTKDDIGEVHLIVGYYVANGNKGSSRRRQNELDVCFLTNLANPYISYVHVLLEDDDHIKAISAMVPEAFVPKLRLHLIRHRPTFKDAFEYANGQLSGQLCILANADIFFDHSLSRIYPPSAMEFDHEVRVACYM